MTELTEKLIVLMLIVVAIAALLRGAKEAGVILTAFIFALIFANLDKFSSFKGAGVEAKLREVVSQAYAAIDQVRELGVNLSTPIIDELAISGRMLEYIPLKYKLERIEKIRENLRKLGASQQEIDEACGTMYGRIERDHVRRILTFLKLANPDKTNLFAGLDDGKMDDMNIAKINQFIATNGLKRPPEIEDWIKDLEYFLQTHKLRREGNWQS